MAFEIFNHFYYGFQEAIVDEESFSISNQISQFIDENWEENEGRSQKFEVKNQDKKQWIPIGDLEKSLLTKI